MKKKIIDERGRLFGKISVLDLAVIAVVAILLVAASAKLNILGAISGAMNTTPVEYTVTVRNVRALHADVLRAGDELRTASGTPVGTVKSFTVRDATTDGLLIDGTHVTARIEGYVDMEIVIAADCSVSNGHYYVDGTFELNVNREYGFFSKYQLWSGVITDFRTVADNG
ncbi:MAG: DUF4330 domain-containing protein [Oscillospiraceae bacterium]|nr:DUF4330 domain-containing protein [Oscillospiraceae bacterium]